MDGALVDDDNSTSVFVCSVSVCYLVAIRGGDGNFW